MKRLSLAIADILAASLLALSAPAAAQDAVGAADLRLLRIAYGIQIANAPLCDRKEPALGVALQSTDQFPQGSDTGFAAPVAFAAILPDSALVKSGIAVGAGLVAIDNSAITVQPGLEDMPLRDSAHAMLGRHTDGESLRLTVIDQQGTREVELVPPMQCRALVEVLVKDRWAARSDGRVIQLGLELIANATDDEIAAIFAHELAHSALHHRDRLAAAGVSKGLGGEFGRDRQLNAAAEAEADRLSVHLLANAGYDPRIAPALWRSALGRKLDAGLFRKQIYQSPENRAQALEREIADYLAGGAPSWPGHLLAKR